jgi:putative FmdB family regulatory protein
MPTYQYKCPSCGYEFEELQSLHEEPIKVCPNCKKETHRIISAGAGFLFKGSGFYQTDYKNKGRKESDSGSSSSSSSSSSESKPASKPESKSKKD